MDPGVQISETVLEISSIGPPRDAIDTRGGIAPEREERFPEQIDAHVVEERGEPLLLPQLSCFPYTAERLGHPIPALCPVRALLAVLLLVPALGSTGSAAPVWTRRIVRRLRSYYGGV